MILVSKLERADLACLCRLSHQTALQPIHYTHTGVSFSLQNKKISVPALLIFGVSKLKHISLFFGMPHVT